MRSLCLAAVAAFSAAGPQPATFAQLECAVAQFALQHASTKLPSTQLQYVEDALNVAALCNTSMALEVDHAAFFSRELQRISDAKSKQSHRVPSEEVGASATFFVATSGSDSNSGTIDAPFATLPRAAAAARAIPRTSTSPVLIYIRAGMYYMGDTPLQLSASDSNVTWEAYPGDEGAGPVVLSGARLLSGLSWSPYGTSGILQASVSISDNRRAAWQKAHVEAPAAPPPLVASLFINGQRQVRARFPNGNPQDSSGICFSATQRPGEGCPGWSSCALSATGQQPAPPSAYNINNIGPNRGNSPTMGCPQCSQNWGTFSYGIYPPPPGHPVYNQPLPGVGWSNNSVYSFWGSPFSRPAGVKLQASSTCDGGHWANVSYSHPEDAVVHMFHPGLWGSWMYAVVNVSRSQSIHARVQVQQQAAPLPGAALWLKADSLQVPDGGSVASWADSSGGSTVASQSSPSAQPTLKTSCINGLPCVVFSGQQYLANDVLTWSGTGTIFAVIQDTGTTTAYGSGVFMVKGGSLNGLGTRTADAVASNDDDPAPVGTTIRTLMMDWAGSRADPGHRDLSARPAVISVSFNEEETNGYVDGCLELQDTPHGGPGTGFEIGTRNAELGRWFTGHIGEILVYPRALNSTERALVQQYLSTTWATASPKHCAAPSSNILQVDFSYGGYQEARGGGINSGQHFYIENVLEELDVPGEWYYDTRTQTLYVWPNGTDLGSAQVAVPLADEIITVMGSPGGPYASNIAFTGLSLTQSRVTFLEQHEVPSGGDWTLHRGGALYVQDAEGITIMNCTFEQTGGNGVLFSNHVQDSVISDSHFHLLGDSAVLFIGSTVLDDGSAPTYPNRNRLARNHIHEWGLYTKQTSCFSQALSANTTLTDNVCYNGPRAGINFNDGFAGGNTMSGNLVFNSVRETGDHGPFNSWDRQPYWTRNGVSDGFPASMKPSTCPDCAYIKAWDVLSGNMMINGYNGVWTYDHDDGSQFFVDTSSFMIWGGCKNYLGNSKNCSGNVILYPGTQGRAAGDRRCQTDDNGVFANQYHEDNTCTSADGDFYTFSGCSLGPSINTTVYHTARNSLYTDTGSSFAQKCPGPVPFSSWQGAGQDEGSSTSITPTIQELMSMGAAVLAKGVP